MVLTPLKIYTISTCSSCKALKKMLDALNVPFEAVDVDLLPPNEKAHVIDTIKRLTPLVAFPTLVIGSKVIVGFKEKEILKAIKKQHPPQPNRIKRFFSKLFGDIP